MYGIHYLKKTTKQNLCTHQINYLYALQTSFVIIKSKIFEFRPQASGTYSTVLSHQKTFVLLIKPCYHTCVLGQQLNYFWQNYNIRCQLLHFKSIKHDPEFNNLILFYFTLFILCFLNQ